MKPFDWHRFLEEDSRNTLEYVDEQLEADDDHEYDVPAEVLESGWLGYPGATDEQIAGAEARLGVRLPPSYRAFLAASNGWRRAGYRPHLWSTDEIEWYAVRHQDTIDIWSEETGANESPDECYFDYGPGQDPIYMRGEYLRDALEIGEVDAASGDITLLIPRVVTPEGEWEAWIFGYELPGAYRSRSFREMLTGNDPGPHEYHVRSGLVWPNRSVSSYIAALGDANPRVRRQAAAALEILGDPVAAQSLAACLIDDVSAEVRENAARALGRLGGRRAVEALTVALHDPDEAVYRTARESLMKAGISAEATAVVRLDGAAVDHLIQALADTDSKVRSYAAYTLRHVVKSDDRVLKSLILALQDEDADVRRYAAESLHVLRDT